MEGQRPASEIVSLKRQMDKEKGLTARLLRLANSPSGLRPLVREAAKLFQEWVGCSGVGIRLRDGNDFPYFETCGIPPKSLEAENALCVTDLSDEVFQDSQYGLALDCMCGSVLSHQFDPSLPFFTDGGSFWTNSMSQLLANVSEVDRQACTCNRCREEGHESVALIPLRADDTVLGLLRLTDHRAGRFSTELIATMETMTAALAEAVAHRLATKELQATRCQLREHVTKLQEGERHLRGLLDAVDQSVMLMEPDGMIRECNQTFAERLGYARPDLLGRNAYTMLPPDVAAQRRQRVEEAQRRRTVVDFVDERWGRQMAHRIVPILDPGDNIVCFAIQGADITDAHQLRDAILQHTHVSAAFLDTKFNFVWVNKTYACKCKHEPDFFPGKNHFELYPSEENQAIFQRVVDTGEPFTVAAKPFVFPDQPERGVTYWDWSLIPVANADGRPIGLVLTLIDVTEQKELENERALTHRTLEAIWSIASIKDADLNTIYDHVIATIAQMTGSPLSFFGLLNDDETVMTVCGWSGEAMEDCAMQETSWDFPISNAGIWAEAVRQRAPLIVNDYSADHPGNAGYPEGHVPLTKLLVVPILSHGRIVSLVAMANRDSDYSTEDVELVTAFMTGIHTVIERRQTEAALRESEERFRKMFRQHDAIMLIIDSETGAIRDANDAAVRFYGYRREQLCQKTIQQINVLLDEEVARRRAQALESECNCFTFPHRLSNGEVRTVEVHSTKISTQNGTDLLSIIHDITDRRRAEEALQESEGRVRAKLNAILEPDGDIGLLSLADVIDVPAVQEMMDEFYLMTGFGIGIVDLNGNVLVATGWQDVCAKFHRVHPRTRANCIASDTQLLGDIQRGQHRLCKCKNNVWDIATPIFVGGKRVGNLVFGQFLFDDEVVDEGVCRAQARQYGFDAEQYLAAFRDLPRLSRATVESVIGFYARFGDLLASLSYSNVKLARLLVEHKRTEEALREALLQQDTAVRAGEIGLWTWDLETNHVGYSDEWKRQIGYGTHEISDSLEEWSSRVHPDDIDGALEKIRCLPSAVSPHYEGEFRFRHKNGSYRWILARASVVRDNEERPIRIMGAHIDITERKRLELQLRDSESLLSQAETIADMGSFVWDIASDRLTTSVGLLRLHQLHGTESPKTLTDAFLRLICPHDRQRVEEEIRRMVAERRTWPIEFHAKRADGEERLIFCESRPVFDSCSELVRMIGTVHDITHQRADEIRMNAMQSQLNHTSRLAVMGELLAGLAHEVNQPLCSIINFAKACQNGISHESVDLDQIRKWTASISAAANRAGDIVRRLLGFARRQGAEPHHTRLREVIDGAVLLVSHEASLRGIALKTVGVDDDLTVCVRPGQIQQVLVNLLRNGVDASEVADGSEVTIKVTANAAEESVEISVDDSGSGIPEETLERLFEPFFTTKPQGLGLGLAISRTIIEEHGGQIEALQNSGGGLTFRLILPIVTGAAEDE